MEWVDTLYISRRRWAEHSVLLFSASRETRGASSYNPTTTARNDTANTCKILVPIVRHEMWTGALGMGRLRATCPRAGFRAESSGQDFKHVFLSKL